MSMQNIHPYELADFIESFKFMEKAVLYEISRQRSILEKGEVPSQENRGYDEKTGQALHPGLKSYEDCLKGSIDGCLACDKVRECM